jgi:galactose-1-phosphate uridylyltransferase
MEFRKETVTAEFLNPLRGFERDAKSIEYRSDPLTGYRSRVSADRAKRVKQAQGVAVDVADIAARSAKSCCFCPDNIDGGTNLVCAGVSTGRCWSHSGRGMRIVSQPPSVHRVPRRRYTYKSPLSGAR